MTEKEKMLAGLPYVASDPGLVAARQEAKLACHRFNQHDPADAEGRMSIMQDLIRMQGSAHIEPTFFCDYGFNIRVGPNFYANHNLVILDVCLVTIGADVMFGPNVMLSTSTHPLNAQERMRTEFGRPIQLGNNVWLGGNVSVLAGVTIGDGSVIGAGSVVTRDIPAGTLAVGNPCRVIRAIDADD